MHATPTTSVIQAAQMAEVYWMALTRDIPFSEFATSSLVRAAAGELHCKLLRKEAIALEIVEKVDSRRNFDTSADIDASHGCCQ